MPKTEGGPRSSTKWRAAGIALFSAATFLLISMGGAIFAAPLTVPLMFVVTHRHPTRAFRTIGAALIGATVAEVVWAVTYVVADEAKPWIWLLPIVGAVVSMTVLVTTSGARERPIARD
jgi:hypothetical protein